MTQPIARSIDQPDTQPDARSVDRPDAAAAPVPLDGSEATGHPVVDEVLGSLQGVAGRPLAEQVHVFEAAHARLHAVLADAGDDPTA